MKHLIILSLFTFHFALFTLYASAAVPLKWTVETSRATPAQFEAYQGETLALEAALQSYGKPLEAPSNYSLYWQTNGMGSTYWSVPCIQTFEQSEHSNILYATWSPTNDVGAKVYNCFIGQPGTIYHAAFQLRLRPSPGAVPNELPLPQKVIDFAKVTVLNPPWSGGGGGGGVDTNAVVDIVHKTVDGSARTTPKYLWIYDCADSYPESAHEYYRSRGNGRTDGGCSSVRDGGFLYRNFDYPFDDRSEFVVHMSSGPERFASVGVAQVGTNLTEQIVTSGKPSRWYKALPGATVDGINENGVACNINVVNGDPHEGGWPTNGTIHCLGAVRWVLDNATNAASAASVLATEVYFPSGWTQNFHYMVADETSTYIVENGEAYPVPSASSPTGTGRLTLTNFLLYPTRDTTGEGQERYDALASGANITNVWYTNAYRRETNPPWLSDLKDVLAYTNDIYNAWASHQKEYFRGKTNKGIPWWQTVHTSVYDISNRVLRVAVQETDDWYVFQVPSSGANVDLAPIEAQLEALQDGKRGLDDLDIRTVVTRYDLVDDASNCSDSAFTAEAWKTISKEGDIYHIGSFPDVYNPGTTWSEVYSGWKTGDYVFFDMETSGSFHDSHTLKFHVQSAEEVIDHLAKESQLASFISTNESGVVQGSNRLRFEQLNVGDNYTGTPPSFKVYGGAGQYYALLEMGGGSFRVYTSDNESMTGGKVYEFFVNGTNVMDWIASKRPLTDNTCHKTEFTEWEFSGPNYDPEHHTYRLELDHGFAWSLYKDNVLIDEQYPTDPENATELVFNGMGLGITATRTAVCNKDKLYVTEDVVDGKVSDAVSTNNPAFVSAVRAIAPATIRTYDSVRQCWWVLEMVNGVPTWTVED